MIFFQANVFLTSCFVVNYDISVSPHPQVEEVEKRLRSQYEVMNGIYGVSYHLVSNMVLVT